MFLKPFRVKTQTSLKNSDRKKLRADIVSQYSCLSEDEIANLIPSKEEMTMTKVHCHGGENVVIYSVAKQPVLFELFKTFYPTVYTLWQYPVLLPRFRTWPPVFEKLQKGADLMLPGVIPDKPPGPKMFGNLKKNDLVCITFAGNRSPAALGRAVLSGEDMYMSALRGKGVEVIHILGDTLWEFGDKSNPPSNPEPLPGMSSDESQDEATAKAALSLEGLQMSSETEGIAGISGESNSANADNETGDDSDERESSKDPIVEMDERLHFCFACAIKSKVKKSDLPLMTGNFQRNFMQPFSHDKHLDLKKSSYKKLSKFLKEKATEGYISVKEQSKGVDVITDMDKTHIGLRDIEVPELREEEATEKAGASTEEIYTPLTFTDVYCVNAATSDLFSVARFNKGDALIITDVRKVVTDYIRENNLQHENDKKTVTLDPILAHTILKPSEGDLDHMNWEQVINRVVGKMQAGVAVSSGSEPPIIRKGKLDPIKIENVMRASSKKVTVIHNLEDYGLDVKGFAKVLQKVTASSSSVVPSEQKNKGPQVHVQGNQIAIIGQMLIDKLKIPKRYVTGLENAPKSKKKK